MKLKPYLAKFTQTTALLSLTFSAAIISGCVSSAGIQHEQKLAEAATLGANAQFDAWPTQDWWKNLRDPELDQLIEQALKENPNIAEAASRIKKAAAYANAANAALAPQVNGSLSISRQRLSENAFYPPPFGGSYQNIADTSLNASWDLDFWGKNHHALKAALSETEAAKAEEAATKLMVSTAVARTYYTLAQQLEQQKLAEQSLKQRDQELDLIKARIENGLDTNVELEQGKAAAYAAHVDLEVAAENASLTRNALAAITAQAPQNLKVQPVLPNFEPQTRPDDIPVDLISHRPDLIAAKARINTASAEIASAKAEFYPNVSLSAFIGLSSFGLSKFIELGSTVAGVGPAVHLPIFDAGKLRANLTSKNADFDIAISSYNEVLLEAIHDVADQITSIKSVRLQSSNQQAALDSAEAAYKLATLRYEAGLTNYITVLVAEDSLLRERSRMVNLKARALDLNIALIKSLGGGFSTPQVKQAELVNPS
ncbi:MAG TPA: efflux transporter outer membrane subunit [Methylophilaceae bacterium]|jgi:NodT family efflux transporter outer membrane factor (OMF) lipoprotein